MQSRNFEDRRAKRAWKHLTMSVNNTIDEMQDDNNRPSRMEYFDEMFRTLYGKGKGLPGMDGKKVIGTYCIHVPEELIYAAGAVPMRLCAGVYDAVDAGRDFLPDISCPVIKSTIGLWRMPILPFYNSCDVVVIPTSCDWKTKLGEIIEEDVPVWMLELPHIKDTEASRQYWLSEIEGLKLKIEKLTGNKITRKGLKQAVRSIHLAQKEFRRLYNTRMSDTPVISGRDAMLVMNAYFYDTVDKWAEAAKALNDELDMRIQKGTQVSKRTSARIMLTGSPVIFPNYKIPNIIEDMGGVLVSDDLCSSNQYINDMVAIDEPLMLDMLTAVANRYLLPCCCPVFTSSEDRAERILQMIDDFKISGVVYHVLKGCHPYDLEVVKLEGILKKKDIPMLKLETDYSLEDIEQLRTRIEAFLETLSSRKGGN